MLQIRAIVYGNASGKNEMCLQFIIYEKEKNNIVEIIIWKQRKYAIKTKNKRIAKTLFLYNKIILGET